MTEEAKAPVTKPHQADECPLTEKLPPKVRMRIFNEVLRSDYPLLIASKHFPKDKRLNVSLLASTLSASGSAELDTAVENDLRCVRFVRHLELVNISDADEWINKDMATTVQTCWSFPKLKSLTITYDACEQSPEPENAFSRWPGLGLSGARCIDVGVYELINEDDKHRAYLKYYALADAWQKVNATPEVQVMRGLQTFVASLVTKRADHRIAYFINSMNLPTWCALVDVVRRNNSDGAYKIVNVDVPNARWGIMETFEHRTSGA
ncbi:hypothetical protein LTR08_005866 [Meristemomyces frigidus]|nr:hypothetical protein LTR08_005866 [Meristemomyces frigidus]